MNTTISAQDVRDMVFVVNKDVVQLLSTANSVLRRYRADSSMADGLNVIGTEIFRSFIKKKLLTFYVKDDKGNSTIDPDNHSVFDRLANPKMMTAFAKVVGSDIWSEEFGALAKQLSAEFEKSIEESDGELIELVIKLKDHKELFRPEDRQKINHSIKKIYETMECYLALINGKKIN